MSTGHREVALLIPAYALGSLDPDEVARVEAHLPGCANCRAALADTSAVVEGLLVSTPAAEPPNRLRQSLERELIRTTRHRLTRGVAWTWIPALLSTTLLALNIVVLLQTRALQAQTERLAESAPAGQLAAVLADDPGSKVASSSDGPAQGVLLYHPGLSTAVLQAWGLAPLAQDRTYQLWLIEADGRRTSGAVFRPDAGEALVSVLVRAPRSLGDFAGFGVTIEPAPGSEGPTGPRVLGSEFR